MCFDSLLEISIILWNNSLFCASNMKKQFCWHSIYYIFISSLLWLTKFYQKENKIKSPQVCTNNTSFVIKIFWTTLCQKSFSKKLFLFFNHKNLFIDCLYQMEISDWWPFLLFYMWRLQGSQHPQLGESRSPIDTVQELLLFGIKSLFSLLITSLNLWLFGYW